MSYFFGDIQERVWGLGDIPCKFVGQRTHKRKDIQGLGNDANNQNRKVQEYSIFTWGRVKVMYLQILIEKCGSSIVFEKA